MNPHTTGAIFPTLGVKPFEHVMFARIVGAALKWHSQRLVDVLASRQPDFLLVVFATNLTSQSILDFDQAKLGFESKE